MWIKGINLKPEPTAQHFYRVLPNIKCGERGGNSQHSQQAAGTQRLPFPHAGWDGMSVGAAQAASCWAPSCATSSVLKPPPWIWVSILMHPLEMIPPFLSPSLCPGTGRGTHWGHLFLHPLAGQEFSSTGFSPWNTLIFGRSPKFTSSPQHLQDRHFEWVKCKKKKKTPHGTTWLAAGISSEGKHGMPQICCNCLGKGFSKAAVLQALLLRCVCNSLLLISSEHLPEAQHLHLQIDVNLKVSDKEGQEMGIARGIEGYSWNIPQVQAESATSFHSLPISTPHFPLKSTDRRYTQTAASLGQELCLW